MRSYISYEKAQICCHRKGKYLPCLRGNLMLERLRWMHAFLSCFSPFIKLSCNFTKKVKNIKENFSSGPAFLQLVVILWIRKRKVLGLFNRCKSILLWPETSILSAMLILHFSPTIFSPLSYVLSVWQL